MQPMCRGQNAHHRQIQPMCRVDYNPSRKPSLYRVHGSLHRDMQPVCRGQNAHNR
ncbi:hypothetical protein KIN20_007961 [Parelaphostrongylus tenuis]|uniref:Uncharacterized protein n=1 Tax=Parelaphostrongylus tenuis TaxID=148309 RepID=A0AAD5M438_PARTN|nr:hypothetical protein KIN20_007961 [Parelaphostrongylus tenuis]